VHEIQNLIKQTVMYNAEMLACREFTLYSMFPSSTWNKRQDRVDAECRSKVTQFSFPKHKDSEEKRAVNKLNGSFRVGSSYTRLAAFMRCHESKIMFYIIIITFSWQVSFSIPNKSHNRQKCSERTSQAPFNSPVQQVQLMPTLIIWMTTF